MKNENCKLQIAKLGPWVLARSSCGRTMLGLVSDTAAVRWCEFEISQVSAFGGLDGIAHEHGDGHWADAAGVRGYFSRDREQGSEIYVADEAGSGFWGRVA